MSFFRTGAVRSVFLAPPGVCFRPRDVLPCENARLGVLVFDRFIASLFCVTPLRDVGDVSFFVLAHRRFSFFFRPPRTLLPVPPPSPGWSAEHFFYRKIWWRGRSRLARRRYGELRPCSHFRAALGSLSNSPSFPTENLERPLLPDDYICSMRLPERTNIFFSPSFRIQVFLRPPVPLGSAELFPPPLRISLFSPLFGRRRLARCSGANAFLSSPEMTLFPFGRR